MAAWPALVGHERWRASQAAALVDSSNARQQQEPSPCVGGIELTCVHLPVTCTPEVSPHPIGNVLAPSTHRPRSLPRVGLHFGASPALRAAQWYGRGPHECYPDRKVRRQWVAMSGCGLGPHNAWRWPQGQAAAAGAATAAVPAWQCRAPDRMHYQMAPPVLTKSVGPAAGRRLAAASLYGQGGGPPRALRLPQ